MRVDRRNRPDFTSILWQTHSIASFFRAKIYLLKFFFKLHFFSIFLYHSFSPFLCKIRLSSHCNLIIPFQIVFFKNSLFRYLDKSFAKTKVPLRLANDISSALLQRAQVLHALSRCAFFWKSELTESPKEKKKESRWHLFASLNLRDEIQFSPFASKWLTFFIAATDSPSSL